MNYWPNERLSQFRINVNYKFEENKLIINLNNPLQCPIRMWIKSEDSSLNSELQTINPILLNPLKDSLFTFGADDIDSEKLDFASKLGDTSKQVIFIMARIL